MIRPANQIKLRLAAKAPEKVDARAMPLFRFMRISPPVIMTRAHKLAWYAKRTMEYEHALENIANEQDTRQMLFSRQARESKFVDDAMVRHMIPVAKEIFQMELKLHRMEMYKSMLRHHMSVEKTPLTVAEERKRITPLERVIRSYKQVEEEMIRVLNDPKELEERTRSMINVSRKKKK